MRYYLTFIASTVWVLQSAYCPLALCSSAGVPHNRLPAPVANSSGSQGESSVGQPITPLHGLDKDPDTVPAISPNGPSDGASSTGVSSAPGADAMMTADLLLVNPNKNGPPPAPLQSFVGVSLKVTLDRSDIMLAGLRGLMITVNNDTNRPLVIDGASAKVFIGPTTYSAVSVAVLQKKILPSHTIEADAVRTIAQVIPAAVTVGLTPTAEDYIRMKKPIRKRYGTDEKRRLAEASRFGKRILWPHQKTQGVLYFQTNAEIKTTDAKVEIPVQTLFDSPDSAILKN